MVRVLLCADVRDDELLGAFLPREAYSIVWEASYEAVKVALERGSYDACLIDALFSNGRGVTLAQTAARRGGRPIIILARRADPAFEAKVLARGIADVLVRPDLTPTELERALRHAIARAGRERRLERSNLAAPTVGLPALEFRLENAIARARRGFGGAAVLGIHFSPQGSFGAQADPGVTALMQGDALERVRSGLREVDTISRVEGTLFVLMEDAEPRFLAAHAADRILNEMTMPFSVRGQAVRITPSIGIAVFPDDGNDGASLLASARGALASASNSGGNVFHFPTSPMTGLAARRIALERSLERAVERDEFTIWYQPQVDLSLGAIVGAEALLRWHDRELGVVPPSEFVPLLESANLIDDVGEWVMRAACAQASRWAHSDQPLKISVNVSAKQFALGDVCGVVQHVLSETRLPPHLLTLEITEGVMLDSTPEIRDTLTQLRQSGVKVAVDDFGTGYASLRYIKHFPMDIIKIDKEFVRGLPLNAENAAITNSIASLAHSLGLEVVAEGVETEAEAEFLRDLRCVIVQGFLHGPPMELSAFEGFWRTLRSKAS